MIGRLNGILLDKDPPLLWLSVNGVGYELEAPLSTFYKLPETGQPLMLYTHFAVREDTHTLFGFATPAEKALFRQLIKVSGVGPKSALTILSGISTEDFWETVRLEDTLKLTRLPGIGKKTAERLVLELRDKASAYASAVKAPDNGEGVLSQAISALVNLGYKPAEARRLSDAAFQPDRSAEEVIREALKRALR
ncbi:MAG: Holliday junction branch migration protein RuvA [Nevskiales bacterium]|nr:Holliday junction branch migration protein RuvA [Nevskiales bacterium]